jgi:transposase InsO family protein
VGQNRITQRNPKRFVDIAEYKLRQRLCEIARTYVQWGRRKAYQLLRREGWEVNHKRVQRLWREEGLQRPTTRKRKRVQAVGGSKELLRAEYPHHVWAINFQFDETRNGRKPSSSTSIDENSRMALAIRVGRRCQSVNVIDTLENLLGKFPAPTHIRMDNGQEFIAIALQEWCVGSGTGTEYIPPGAPRENPFVESFNSRIRDDFLNIGLFMSVCEARMLAKRYRMEYNTYRPHSCLKWRTPLEGTPAMEGGMTYPPSLIASGPVKGVTSLAPELKPETGMTLGWMGWSATFSEVTATIDRVGINPQDSGTSVSKLMPGTRG